MKKLAVLALFVLLIPSVLAIIAQTHKVTMQTTFITQGYEFARLQGFNRNDIPVNVPHWHMTAELGALHAFCEFQPAILPPGPYDVELTVQCQTLSGFTTMFPNGNLVDIETFVADNIPENSFTVEKVWIETRPQLPTAFPISPIGHAVIEQETSKAGTFMFIAGMAAIAVVALAVVLFSRRKE